MSSSRMSPIFVGTCPDEGCKSVVFSTSRDKFVDCLSCGQQHDISAILDVKQVQEQALGVKTVLRSLLLATSPTMKKSSDLIKVNGLSHYHCKLLSPFLTHYGMDKVTSKPKPLSELTKSATFDCGMLCSRAFLIQPNHLDIPGFGRDQTGSTQYLAEILQKIEDANGYKDALVPLHVDGDGHCLVHAVSRALVGRELFWHPLRSHLKSHILERRESYKELLQDFINASEWDLIIEECDPCYEPDESKGEILGLRNIHIFGLANVLKRPLILLDSVAGMNCSGDYSAVFLPVLVDPADCKDKTGEFNPPLCLAWNSSARNHFIPLVGVKGDKLPVIPRKLLPETWVVSHNNLPLYMKFDENDSVVIGGDKILQEAYIKKLTTAMDELFLQKYNVHPSVVCDNYQYNYRKTSATWVSPETVTAQTQKAAQEHRLYRCLECQRINLDPVSSEWLRPGPNGLFYNVALQHYGTLVGGKAYAFAQYGVSCSYDAKKDVLILAKHSALEKCNFCLNSKLRIVHADGTTAYENGDVTPQRSTSNHCHCGFKHWWAGKEYDNPPEMIPVSMSWKGREVTENVAWFQHEADPNTNSNAYQIASFLVQKHFPGEFGSERLVQNVVSQILEFSKFLDIMDNQMSDSASQLPILRDFSNEEPSTQSLKLVSELSPTCIIPPRDDSSGADGPVAVHLLGNREKSKKMAAMTHLKEKELPASKADFGKVEGMVDSRLQKAQIDLKEQQMEYKLRMDREYQLQNLKKSPQLPSIGRGLRMYIEDEDDGFWNEEAIIGSITPITELIKPSTKTVRVGPGYSVLRPSTSTTPNFHLGPTAPSSSATSKSRVSKGTVPSCLQRFLVTENDEKVQNKKPTKDKECKISKSAENIVGGVKREAENVAKKNISNKDTT